MHTSPCPHRPECPGCALIERPYDEQLAVKTAAVRAALAPYHALGDVAVAPCAGTGDRAGWRRRVKWVADGDHIGLYGAGHSVVDTPGCLVVPAAAHDVAHVLRQRPAATDAAHLTGVDLRVTAAGAVAATLIVEAAGAEVAQAYAQGLATWLHERAVAALGGVAWSLRAPGSAAMLGGLPQPVWGETSPWDAVGLVATPFPPGVFSQAHGPQTAALQAWLREVVGAREDRASAHLVDLYAGTGGLGLAVAGAVQALTLVESFAPAAQAAQEAAERVSPGRARVWARAVEEALADAQLAAVRPLFVIADPPRTGFSGVVLRALARLAPELLCAVSCEPRTLARDLALLATHGLRTRMVVPFDMMPATDQVECAAALVPGDPVAPPVIADVAGLVAFDKPPLLPTTPHPEWPCSLVDFARALDVDLVPIHRLDEGTSGVTIFRRRAATAGADVLAGVRKTYTALVKGVTHRGGTVARPLREQGRVHEARTRFRRVAVTGGHSLVEVEPATGRTHQIRRHFAMIGHPVLGDARYGDVRSNRHFEHRHGLVRPFLHAGRVVLGDGTAIECPLAPDLAAVLASIDAGGRALVPAPGST